jgi:hypothetical protein
MISNRYPHRTRPHKKAPNRTKWHQKRHQILSSMRVQRDLGGRHATLLYLALDIGLSAKSGLLIQYVEVAFVEKQTASSFSTGLPQDASFDQAIHGSGSSWETQLHLACCVPD